MSDGYQSLTFKQFEDLMALCRKVAAAVDRVMVIATGFDRVTKLLLRLVQPATG